MNDRQQHAFANPVATPDETSADEGFTRYTRLAGGVLVTILTVNR